MPQTEEESEEDFFAPQQEEERSALLRGTIIAFPFALLFWIAVLVIIFAR